LICGVQFKNIFTIDESDIFDHRDFNNTNPEFENGAPASCQRDFERAPQRVDRKSDYMVSIMNFLAYFNRSNIMIINSGTLYANTSDTMVRIAKFLDIEPIKTWTSKPLPHATHLERSFGGRLRKFKNNEMKQRERVISCVLSHVPKLDCAYRSHLTDYYLPSVLGLYRFLAATKQDAPHDEPTFPPFNLNATPCVANARQDFDALLKVDASHTTCLSWIK
jgi:hypothetical protein